MDSLLTPLVSLSESVYSSVSKRVNHLKDFKQRIARMVIKLEELKETRDDLKREIEQAELGEWKRTNQVKGWLERVEKTEAEANLMLAQPVITAAVTQGGMWCKNPSSCSARYKLSKKALQKEAEINELITKKETLDILAQRCSSRIHPIPCVPTVGLNPSLEAALHTIITDDGAGIIGIYGIGGVGKTTLLKQINNESVSRTNEFEAVIWVTVSKDFCKWGTISSPF